MLKILLKLLKLKRLKPASRVLILNSLLESISSIPIKDIITFDEQGTILVQGKPLSTEQSIQLREGAISLDNNWAYRLIKDQVAFEAIKMGVHSSTSMEMILMSKAAIWNNEQEKRLIAQLSGEVV